MPKRPGCFAIELLIGGHRSFDIVSPQIADCRHLHILLIFERRHNAIEFAAAIADPDMPERDPVVGPRDARVGQDRKSTRLNSSHSQISYAVFCLKKKKHNHTSCCY